MTVLEITLSLLLFFLVPAVVWLAVDTWALRRDVDRLDAALEDARNTTDDLDVPHVDDPDTPTTPVYRPVPEHFNEWR